MTRGPSAEAASAEPKWIVASASGGGNCIRAAALASGVIVGDTKDPDGPVQFYGMDEWRRFIHQVKSGFRPE
ncbi:DUF397 domain-containing protein [Spirillospora sp. NPDC049024]